MSKLTNVIVTAIFKTTMIEKFIKVKMGPGKRKKVNIAERI